MKALHSIRKVIDMVTSGACVFIFAVMVVVGTYQIVRNSRSGRRLWRKPSVIRCSTGAIWSCRGFLAIMVC